MAIHAPDVHIHLGTGSANSYCQYTYLAAKALAIRSLGGGNLNYGGC